jgi:hypothetical protein
LRRARLQGAISAITEAIVSLQMARRERRPHDRVQQALS